LACVKLGVIYTNIDPEIPVERFKHILKLCHPARIFTDHECPLQLLTACIDTCFHIEKLAASNYQDHELTGDLNAIIANIDGDAIAYIMFTSGSTGKPKGVAITHQNLLHFIQWGISRYNITANDSIANVNPMYFDNSVFDFYISLYSGASLVPVKKSLTARADQLVNYVEKMQCSIWFSVPSLFIYLMTMKVLHKESFMNIRIISFGGEGYPKVELKKMYDLFKSRIRFINVYGPTECTCICSSYEMQDADFDDLHTLPSLGKINPNFSFLILNENDVNKNAGELCLLGPNVGRGYYNQQDTDYQAFCEYSGNGYYRSRMYRTGDMVTLKDGLLYFNGRKDNQIKHMGYRIELEEIEIAIGLVAGVNQVAVLYEKNTTGYGKIIAYVASSERIDSRFIREHIIQILPTYMMPNTIIMLDHLPKNQNGKIDKTALRTQQVDNVCA